MGIEAKASAQVPARSTGRIVFPISALALTITVAMIVVATQFRPIADDYFHIGRVMEMGILGSTADWYRTLLPGVLGVLLMSLFASPFGHVPDFMAYIPYTAFVVGVLYILGLTLLKPYRARTNRKAIAALAATVPPLWLLSMGNLFPQYDIINVFGMMSWISNGYRVHLPFLLFAFFLWMNWWQGSRLSGGLVGGVGMLVLTLNFLNPLPDIAAYFFLCTAVAIHQALRSTGTSPARLATPVVINGSMAAGVLVGFLFLFLSPGTASRIDTKPLQFSWESALTGFPQQALIFLREMMNVSHVLVLVGALGISLLAASSLTSQERRRCAQEVRFMSVVALALLALLFGTGIIGETLTYNAIFHRWAVLQIQFVVVVLLGLWLGMWMATAAKRTPSPAVAGAATAVALLASVVPLLDVYQLSIERRQVWETGQPAPVSFMVDREQAIFQDWWDRIRPPDDSAGE